MKNCGYPVHLQISRKEFLNELVKRFPERPPPAYSRVQRLILGTLAEWVQTICKTARYKDDLTYIKDMYRLLRSKGYDFPAVKKEDAAVLNPSDNLKSIEELQQEERLFQSAKLQELIRRGRPQDLKEANDLMKIMSGFKEDEALEETKQKVYDDLEKLSRKTELLNDMLNNATNSGTLNSNDDTLQELISTIKVSQPRVQKIIQEEEGSDKVSDLLVLNDKINSTLLRVAHLKGEDTSKFQQSSTSASSKQPQSMNLIDFGDDDDIPGTPTGDSASPQPNTNDALNDLLGDLGGLSFDNSKSSNNCNSQFGVGAINLFGTPEPQSNKPLSTHDILSGFNTPSPQQQQTQQFPLVSASHQAQPSTTSQLDPFGFDFTAPTPAATTLTNNATSPQLSLFSDNNIAVEYTINTKQPVFDASFHLSNKSSNPLSNIQLSLAVTKSFDLLLKSPSSINLSPNAKNGIKQEVTIRSKSGESFNTLKLKYKLSYSTYGSPVESSGVVTITL